MDRSGLDESETRLHAPKMPQVRMCNDAVDRSIHDAAVKPYEQNNAL